MRDNDVRGYLDGLILAALADGPAHGYSVIGRIRDRSSGAFELAKLEPEVLGKTKVQIQEPKEEEEEDEEP